MDHLSEEQRIELRRRLETEREQLRERLSSEDAEAVPQDSRGDMQDRASQEARQTTAFQRRRHHDARLREVEAALGRMDDGSYGLCEETDEPLSFGRLSAEPTTRHTVEALEMLEEESARGKAKVHGADERDAY